MNIPTATLYYQAIRPRLNADDSRILNLQSQGEKGGGEINLWEFIPMAGRHSKETLSLISNPRLALPLIVTIANASPCNCQPETDELIRYITLVY